jgi:hypothetical protein
VLSPRKSTPSSTDTRRDMDARDERRVRGLVSNELHDGLGGGWLARLIMPLGRLVPDVEHSLLGCRSANSASCSSHQHTIRLRVCR